MRGGGWQLPIDGINSQQRGRVAAAEVLPDNYECFTLASHHAMGEVL